MSDYKYVKFDRTRNTLFALGTEADPETIYLTTEGKIINNGNKFGGDEQLLSDWQLTDTTAKDYIKNKPIIPAAQVNADWEATEGIAEILNKPYVPSVINDTTSTSTTEALSANMGKELLDEINNLKSRGRFLALWNAATGLALSDPTVSPYTYHAGDYFIVGTVSTGTTVINYKPEGTQYVIGTASTVQETEELAIDDVYYFDSNTWRLQKNTLKTISFSNIAGQPSDNTNLATALNNKQDTLVSGTNIKTVNSLTLLGNGNLEISTYAPFPSDFTTSGSLATIVSSILSSSGAKKGMAYLGLIFGSCTPWGFGLAECKIEFMTNSIAVLSINSSDMKPYTWQYNTYSEDYTWKKYSDVSFTQVISSGTKIGTITIDGIGTNIYSPTIDISGKEDKSNKVTTFLTTPDDIHYPSEKLVKDNLDSLLGLIAICL